MSESTNSEDEFKILDFRETTKKEPEKNQINNKN